MNLLAPISAVGWVTGVFGTEKSFVANPIIGNAKLNEWDLHRARVKTAERMARLRRGMMTGVSDADKAAYNRDGFVIKENYLPDDVFKRVRDEVFDQPLPAREMRQGQTVTRMIPLSHANRTLLPEATTAAWDKGLNRLTGYVAGRTGAPSKFWLFLHDVDVEDGPFIFAPGSHKLTPQRLAWEYEQSLTARAEKRAHHSYGSFRINADQMEALGYQLPRQVAVPANTLVVADTYGFHSRSPSSKPTIRTELHGHLRRNPFAPWNGLDLQGLPGINHRQLEINNWWLAKTGQKNIWRDVGMVRANAEAEV